MINKKLLSTEEEQSFTEVDRTRSAAFSRSWTENLAFPRMLTETAYSLLDFENEEAIMRKLIDEYKEVAVKGPEGDIPIPEGFGTKSVFWKIAGMSVIFGFIMGVAAVGVLNCANEIPKIWIDNGNFNDIEDFDYYNGSLFWVVITTCTGFLVGIIRWASSYPDDLPGFFKEVNSCHVDPKYVPLTVSISALSLAGGATLGPEACLGNLGGGMGTLISDYISFESEEDKKLLVLSSMAAALGSLFPSPFLAVLMIKELCISTPKPYMETTVIASIAATASFSVYYSISGFAYLEALVPKYELSMVWEFELVHCYYGWVIGLLSGCLCLFELLAIGVCKQIFIRLKTRCDSVNFLSGTIIAPTVGGLIIGLIYWVLPMTVADGNIVSAPIISITASAEYSGTPHLDEDLLLRSMFGKMFTLAISMNCGMVGGFIFPMLTVGVIASALGVQRYPDIPILLFISCFMSGIPSGICPMPFTLICLPIILYFVGLEQTAPIFISSITSYMVVCGSGLFAALASRGIKKTVSDSEDKTDGVPGFGKHKKIYSFENED